MPCSTNQEVTTKVVGAATRRFLPRACHGILMTSDDSNHLMGASISGNVMEKERDGGLVERHAYSLLSAVQVQV